MKKYQTITFKGHGNIIASAIKKTSKNYYVVYIIEKNFAMHSNFNSIRDAKLYLEKYYSLTSGNAPGVKQ